MKLQKEQIARRIDVDISPLDIPSETPNSQPVDISSLARPGLRRKRGRRGRRDRQRELIAAISVSLFALIDFVTLGLSNGCSNNPTMP